MKTQSTPQQREYTFFQKQIIPLIINFITFLVYYPSLAYGFIFDDLPTIVQYFHVRVFDPAGQFFTNPRWISRVLNQFLYYYWKDSPFVYRIVNLFMHLVIGLLVFHVMLHLLSRMKNMYLANNAYLISLLASGIFLLYPIQTQTVTYITQMQLEGLVMLFTFAIIATFVFAVTSEKRHWRNGLIALSYLLIAFAAGTKEIIIALPFLLLLVDWFLVAQGNWLDFKSRLFVHAGYFVVLFGVLAYMGVARPAYISHIATNPIKNNRGNLLTQTHDQRITTYNYLISQFKVILHYLTLFFTPHRVCFDYDMKLASTFFAFDVLASFLLLLMLIGAAVKAWIKDKGNLYVFCFAWFMISILPRASIFPSTELVCDYKTYVASFGPLLCIALLATSLINYLVTYLEKRRSGIDKGITQFFLSLAMFFGLGYATGQRNIVWSSDLAFWKDATVKAPTKARGFNNYGTALWARGDSDGAIEAFKQAIAKDGFYGEPHVNLASIYQGKGIIDEAMKHYKRAMEIGEGHPEMFHNLGMLHFSQKSYDKSAICFEEAIRLRPHYGRALINLGRSYQLQNKNDKAIEIYERALASDYQDRDLYYLHGSLCYDMGKYDRAVLSLESVDKRFMDTSFKLGCCYFNTNNIAKAAECFERALEVEPTNLMYAYNCGQACLKAGKFDKALKMFDQCKSREQELPYVPLHRSKCLFYLGKKDDAYKSLNMTIKSTKHEGVRKDGKLLKKEFADHKT